VKSAVEAVDKAYHTIEGLLNINDMLKKMKQIGENISKSFSGLDQWETITNIIFGFFDGFTLGGADFLQDVMKTSYKVQNGALDKIKDSLKNVGTQISLLFGGVFDDDIRHGKSRMDWVKDGLKNILDAISHFFATVWDFVESTPLKGPLNDLLLSVVALIGVTAALLAVPGVGWFIKLAAMIITCVLAFIRLITKTIPKFIGAAARCIANNFACAPKDTKILIQSFTEMVGMCASVLLASFPDQSAKSPALAEDFNKSEIAMATKITFTPALLEKSTSVREAITGGMSGGENGAQVMKALKG